MSWLQRIVVWLLPRKWAEAAEAESRAWMMQCVKCGHEQSVWDAGGIRWGARGRSRTYRRCESCRKYSWQKVVRETEN